MGKRQGFRPFVGMTRGGLRRGIFFVPIPAQLLASFPIVRKKEKTLPRPCRRPDPIPDKAPNEILPVIFFFLYENYITN